MDLLQLLNEYRIILGTITTLLLTAIFLYVWWERVSLWALSTWCAFPFVGRVARLSQDTTSATGGWFMGERSLCADFAKHHGQYAKDGEFFDKCQIYLDKVHEKGRNPLHLFGWILIAMLVFVEAVGFAYVLAGYTLPGASESLQQKGAAGIAFLVSSILVFLTHQCGHELHSNSLVRKVRIWFLQDQREDRPPLIPESGVSLDRNADDGSPGYLMLLNRLETNAKVTPRLKVTVLTTFFVVAVAVGATYVRGQVLEQEIIEETALMREDLGPGADYVSPFDDVEVPADVRTDQAKADEAAGEAVIERKRAGGWGTFVVLAVVFVFLQVVGVLIGMRTGFAGKESRNARRFIGRFQNREEFEAYYSRRRAGVERTAQKHLTRLQQRMRVRAQTQNLSATELEQMKKCGDRTFLAYLRGARAEEVYDMRTQQPPPPQESVEAREARIRRRLEAERAEKQAAEAHESDEEIEARLRREMGLDE
ncbi:MAG: hypothetical protein ACQGVK_25870 [Myxococcota bacterium]